MMVFPEDMIRGRKKGSTGNVVRVRRYTNEKYNTYHELKDKKVRKKDKGICRITIPRSIADSMNLNDGDFVEFINHTRESLIIRKLDKHDI